MRLYGKLDSNECKTPRTLSGTEVLKGTVLWNFYPGTNTPEGEASLKLATPQSFNGDLELTVTINGQRVQRYRLSQGVVTAL